MAATGGPVPNRGYSLDGRAAAITAKAMSQSRGVRFNLLAKIFNPRAAGRAVQQQLRAPVQAAPTQLATSLKALSSQLGHFKKMSDTQMTDIFNYLTQGGDQQERNIRSILDQCFYNPAGQAKDDIITETVEAFNHARGFFKAHAKQVQTSTKVAHWHIHSQLKQLDYKKDPTTFGQELQNCQRQMDAHMDAIFNTLNAAVTRAFDQQGGGARLSPNGNKLIAVMQQNYQATQKLQLMNLIIGLKFGNTGMVGKYFFAHAKTIPVPLKKQAAKLILDKHMQQVRAAPEMFFKDQATDVLEKKKILKDATHLLKTTISKHRKLTANMNEKKQLRQDITDLQTQLKDLTTTIAEAELYMERCAYDLQMARLDFYGANQDLFTQEEDRFFTESIEKDSKTSPADFAFFYDCTLFVRQEAVKLAESLGIDPGFAGTFFDNTTGKALLAKERQQKRMVAAQKPFVVNAKRAAEKLRKDVKKRTFDLDRTYQLKGLEGAINGIVALNHDIHKMELAANPQQTEMLQAYQDRKAELLEYTIRLKADQYYADALLDKDNKEWDPKKLRDGIYKRIEVEMGILMGGHFLGDSVEEGKAASMFAGRASNVATLATLRARKEALTQTISTANNHERVLAEEELEKVTKQIAKLTRATTNEKINPQDLEDLQKVFFMGADKALNRVKETLSNADISKKPVLSKVPEITDEMTIEQIMLLEPSRIGQFDQVIDRYRQEKGLKVDRAALEGAGNFLHNDLKVEKAVPQALTQGTMTHRTMFQFYGSLTISQMVEMINPQLLDPEEVNEHATTLKARFEQILRGPALDEHAFDYVFKGPEETTVLAHTQLPPPLTAMPTKLTQEDYDRITLAPKLFTAKPSKQALNLFPFIAGFLKRGKAANAEKTAEFLETVNHAFYIINQLTNSIPPLTDAAKQNITTTLNSLIPAILNPLMVIEGGTSTLRYHVLEEMAYVVESLFVKKVTEIGKTDLATSKELAAVVQGSIKTALVEFLFNATVDKYGNPNEPDGLLKPLVLSHRPIAQMLPQYTGNPEIDHKLRVTFNEGFLQNFKQNIGQRFPLRVMVQRLFAGDMARGIDDAFVLKNLRSSAPRMAKVQTGQDQLIAAATGRGDQFLSDHLGEGSTFEDYQLFDIVTRKMMETSDPIIKRHLKQNLINVKMGIIRNEFEFFNKLKAPDQQTAWTSEMESYTRIMAKFASLTTTAADGKIKTRFKRKQLRIIEGYIKDRRALAAALNSEPEAFAAAWKTELTSIEEWFVTWSNEGQPSAIALVEFFAQQKADAVFGSETHEAKKAREKIKQIRDEAADLHACNEELTELINELGTGVNLGNIERVQKLRMIGLWNDALTSFLNSCITDAATRETISVQIEAKKEVLAPDAFRNKAFNLLDHFAAINLATIDNAALTTDVQRILDA